MPKPALIAALANPFAPSLRFLPADVCFEDSGAWLAESETLTAVEIIRLNKELLSSCGRSGFFNGAELGRVDLGRGKLWFWQYMDGFRFGEDAVALAHFAADCARDLPRDGAFIELGCGGGGMMILLAELWPQASGLGVELSVRQAELAAVNLRINRLETRLKVFAADVRTWRAEEQGASAFDLILCNPPYRAALPRGGLAAEGPEAERQRARFDFSLKHSDLALLGARLLKPEGRFCILYPLVREAELFNAFAQLGLAPAYRRLLVGWRNRPARLALYSFAFEHRSAALREGPDLVLRDADGCWTQEGERYFASCGRSEI